MQFHKGEEQGEVALDHTPNDNRGFKGFIQANFFANSRAVAQADDIPPGVLRKRTIPRKGARTAT